MQEEDRQKLEQLLSICIRDKHRLKQAHAIFETLPAIHYSDFLAWRFFRIAVFRAPNEEEALTQLGNNFAKLLVEKGLSANISPWEAKENTLLHLAVRAGNLVITKFLVKDHCAEIDDKNGGEETPLDIAKKALKKGKRKNPNLEKIIEYLNKHKFKKIVTYIAEGFSSGSYDTSSDFAEAKQFIEERLVLPKKSNASMWRLLRVSFEAQRNDIAELILTIGSTLSEGISVDAKTKYHFYEDTYDVTALHLAAGVGNSAMVKYCLKKHASWTEKDAKNRTPLDVAIEKKETSERENNNEKSRQLDEVITLFKLEEFHLKLNKLCSDCFKDKNRLKEAKELLKNISITPSIAHLLWDFFGAAVFKNDNNDDNLTQLGNEFAKFLIEEMSLSTRDMQPQSYEGTVLHQAAGAGNLEIVKYLVEEKNADITAINDADDKQTPLDRAKEALADFADLTDLDPTEIQMSDALKQVIAYLEQKHKEHKKPLKPLLALDSPILTCARPTFSLGASNDKTENMQLGKK